MTAISNTDLLIRELGHAGRNSFVWEDDDRNAGRPVTLHTYRAHGHTPEHPVVIVQHGVLRNGDDYRDFWIDAADRYKLLVIAPTFSDAVWPGVDSYNNGRVFTPSGNPRTPAAWAYALVVRLAQTLRDAEIVSSDNTKGGVHLFGHSAGGQFVHRLASSQPLDGFSAIAVGNPGCYTLPTLDHVWPAGLAGVGLDEGHLKRLLAYPLTILAGDQDNDPAAPHLPADDFAMRQGAHRFARAQHYFDCGQREAARLGVPCHWRLQVVPGIGHDGAAMSAVCASLWFDGRLPDAATLAKLAGHQVA